MWKSDRDYGRLGCRKDVCRKQRAAQTKLRTGGAAEGRNEIAEEQC